MRGGRLGIDAQRRLIMGDGIVEDSVLEQQVADVYDRGNAAAVRLECGSERGDRGGSVAAVKLSESTLVFRQRAFGARRTTADAGRRRRFRR
jgi:hypothetical protein